MEKKDIVVAQDLTPERLKKILAKKRRILGELEKQVDLGILEPGKGLSFDQLQAVTEHRNPFSKAAPAVKTKPSLITDFKDVISILGEAQVLTAEQAAEVWQIKVAKSFKFNVSEQFILEAAKANERGENWRFGYIHRLSLIKQREIMGTDTKNQPCFHKDNTWWLEESSNGYKWATQAQQAGVQLIDFNGRWASISWPDQTKLIKKLGPTYERAREQAVTQMVFSFFKFTGERLLETWYHWGHSLSSSGSRVCVGNFDSNGLNVNIYPPLWGDLPFLRVCLLREF